MIKRELYERCIYLTSLYRMTFDEIKEMESIIQTKMDKRFAVCVKCKAQIKHAQRILKNWVDQQTIIEDVIETIQPNDEPILVEPTITEVVVDEEEAKKVGCSKCGKRKPKSTTPKTKN